MAPGAPPAPAPHSASDDVARLLDGDIATAVAALRGGRVSATALAEAARTRAIGTAYNAVVHVDGGAAGQGGALSGIRFHGSDLS